MIPYLYSFVVLIIDLNHTNLECLESKYDMKLYMYSNINVHQFFNSDNLCVDVEILIKYFLVFLRSKYSAKKLRYFSICS